MATISLFSQRLRPSFFSRDSSAFVCKACRRHVASYRRTRKVLRVKADPSFAPSVTEPHDHIIFNPPPSIPNVYHTPAKFLPKADPRRALYTGHLEAVQAGRENAAAACQPQGVLASIAARRAGLFAPTAELKIPAAENFKPVRPIYQKKYHLGEQDLAEMRRLRTEDPKMWTRNRLAEKFDCSTFFVALCCSSWSPETAERMREYKKNQIEEIKARWGRRKRDAKEARAERRKLWGRDA